MRMIFPVFGISGCTCSGKTSIVQLLKVVFPKAVTFNQDNYYFQVDDKRHVWCETLKHINWELVTAFDNDLLADDVDSESKRKIEVIDKNLLERGQNELKEYLKSGKPVLINSELEVAGDFLKIFESFREQVSLVAVEGITIFNHPRTQKLFRRKFFLTLDYQTCSSRRVRRKYDPPDVPGYFETVVWPEYVKILEEVRQQEVQELDGRKRLKENFVEILSLILDSLN